MKKISVNKLKGTPFQKKVWRELMRIPKGKTITYKKLARKIGKMKAVRAVGNAVGANPCAPFIPCHRVIRSNGSLGGYRLILSRLHSHNSSSFGKGLSLRT